MIFTSFAPFSQSGSADRWTVLDHADQLIATVSVRRGRPVITPVKGRALSAPERRSIADFLAPGTAITGPGAMFLRTSAVPLTAYRSLRAGGGL